jgi:H(+)-transporting ATP synthase subunit D
MRTEDDGRDITAEMVADNLNISPLLATDSPLTASFAVKGAAEFGDDVSMEASGKIGSLLFNGYNYSNIAFDASHDDDMSAINVGSTDPSLKARLQAAMMAPKQEVYLKTDTKNVMSVDIPVFDYTTRTADQNDIFAYGFAYTSSDLDGAVQSLSDALPDMLKLAEVEKSCQLMASEIEKTRRRVNALEHVIIPETQQGIRYITMKLDENERSTQVRLMKVKDMMLNEAHHYDEKMNFDS